jgi:diguanylate cyclase (GGDEF)-like protein
MGDRDWIKNIQELENSKRVVSMMNFHLFAPQAFLVSIKNIKETLHTIIIFTEITNITIEKKEFKQKAFTDELTGIYNRAYFNEELSKQIAICKREKIPFCFIILDIDKFKNFNDTYGHQIGDEVLKTLAKIINKYTRVTDTFARWGGEEFVKILPNTSIDEAIKVAVYLRKEIQSYTFVDDLKVTCSFGISQFNNGDTKDSLIKRADDALYKAKANGRNRVEIELNGVGDNPIFFPDEDMQLSGANFQGTPVAVPMDMAGACITMVSVMSERRMNRLNNPALSVGLPAFLTKGAGMFSGLMLSQYTADMQIVEQRILSAPASIQSIPAAADQEDFVSMGMNTAIKNFQILDNAYGILGIEMMAAAQALDFRKEELLHEIKIKFSTNLPEKYFEIFNSWEEFLDKYVKPVLEKLEKLKNK